jgi:hypothetical protein
MSLSRLLTFQLTGGELVRNVRLQVSKSTFDLLIMNKINEVNEVDNEQTNEVNEVDNDQMIDQCLVFSQVPSLI